MARLWCLLGLCAGCIFRIQGVPIEEPDLRVPDLAAFDLAGADFAEDLAAADFAGADLTPPADFAPPDLTAAPDLLPSLNGFPSHVASDRYQPAAADLTNVTAIRTTDPIGVQLNGGPFAIPPG